MYNDIYPTGGGRADGERPSSEETPRLNGKAKIRVIGVGGAGNNAVNRMIEAGITSAEYIAANTDAQILACNMAPVKIQLGAQLTKGLGAGADPKIGRDAAEDSKVELEEAIKGTDILFIAAGMGGGTGTGAAPVIASIAREQKILTVAVVTKPFEFEGKHRMDNALEGIANLRKYVDTLIVIPNEKISEVVPITATFQDSLRVADEVLMQGIRGIAELIVTPALINLDYADVKTILKDKGMAHMGVGVAKGENRTVEALRLAVNSPLLDTTIEGATGIIFNVVGGPDLTLNEVRTAASLIKGVVHYTANIIVGACIDPSIDNDEVEVTVIATGFPPSADDTEAIAQAESRQAPAPRGGASARPQYTQYTQPAQRQQPPATPVPLYQTPAPAEPAPVEPTPAPAPAPAEPAPKPVEDKSEEPDNGRKLPPFVQRILGKKN